LRVWAATRKRVHHPTGRPAPLLLIVRRPLIGQVLVAHLSQVPQARPRLDNKWGCAAHLLWGATERIIEMSQLAIMANIMQRAHVLLAAGQAAAARGQLSRPVLVTSNLFRPAPPATLAAARLSDKIDKCFVFNEVASLSRPAQRGAARRGKASNAATDVADEYAANGPHGGPQGCHPWAGVATSRRPSFWSRAHQAPT
jgi:hypothetical protein